MCGGPRPRQFVGARTYLNQWGIVMRVTWTSVFSSMAEIDSAPSLNAASCDKKSASMPQTHVLTNFNPFDPNKKSAVLRQKNQLVCGSLPLCLVFFSLLADCVNTCCQDVTITPTFLWLLSVNELNHAWWGVDKPRLTYFRFCRHKIYWGLLLCLHN